MCGIAGVDAAVHFEGAIAPTIPCRRLALERLKGGAHVFTIATVKTVGE
jgi:hypothetical protein